MFFQELVTRVARLGPLTDEVSCLLPPSDVLTMIMFVFLADKPVENEGSKTGICRQSVLCIWISLYLVPVEVFLVGSPR